MLLKTRKTTTQAKGRRFAIVASKYNGRYVNSMLKAARETLHQSGASEVLVVRVPGAFEIPVMVAELAGRKKNELSAIICLGVIIRGETTHAQHIAEAVTSALVHLQVEYRIPVVHEVLLLENAAQARARCLDAERNRGFEAATTAIEMAKVMGSLRKISP
ncbi:MAG: 6,7-dimethyl-8-ribityllumazine synthase [Pedosphaera sp.]|nr:6,7-dimethyl-8-ribityllumazine synthase [Pedosphaera sp.]